jgi:hypothetical protein
MKVRKYRNVNSCFLDEVSCIWGLVRLCGRLPILSEVMCHARQRNHISQCYTETHPNGLPEAQGKACHREVEPAFPQRPFHQRPDGAQGRFRGLRHAERQRFHDQRLCRGGAGGTPHDQRPHQGRPCGGQGARRQARWPATARNQQSTPGGRARASTGHCADSLGIDRHVGPCRGWRRSQCL